jgi:hypothetical protein
MGREIRRVPADWVHPKEWALRFSGMREDYIPLFDKDFTSALAEWEAGKARWDSYEDTDRIRLRDDGSKYAEESYEEWSGGPPSPESYRERAWMPEEATHYQMYETVTEGTPVSPVFVSLAELEAYMVAELGYSPAVAKAFCASGWAPSFIMSAPTGVVNGMDALGILGNDEGEE